MWVAQGFPRSWYCFLTLPKPFLISRHDLKPEVPLGSSKYGMGTRGWSLAHTSPAAILSYLQGIKNWSRKAKNISFLLPARSTQYYRLGEILTSIPEF